MNVENDSKKTAITATLNAVANMISLVVGMIMVPIITRVLSTTDLGIATTFLSTRSILTIVFTFAIYAYVNKAMLEFANEKKNFVFSLIVFCFVTVIAFFLISLPLKSFLQTQLKIDDFQFYWLFISCFTFALYNIANYYCTFHNYYKIVASIVLVIGTFAPVLSVVLAYLMPNHKYIGRIIGVDTGYVLVAVIFGIWIVFFGKKKFGTKYIKRSLKFTVPVMPHLLSQILLAQCDLLMINYIEGEDKSGIYSMGHTVGYLALTVVIQIMAAWSPWVYRRFEENNFSIVKKNSRLILIICTYVSLGLMTISSELIKIFLPKEYLPCIYMVPPLVMATYFEFIYLFFYDILYYNKKAKLIAGASIITSIINIVLNAIFIKLYGYMAACYTTAFSYLVLIVMAYFMCRKFQVHKIYNVIYMVFWIFIVIAYAVLVMFFADNIIVRYGVFIGISLTIFIMKRKEIIYFVKNIKKMKNH